VADAGALGPDVPVATPLPPVGGPAPTSDARAPDALPPSNAGPPDAAAAAFHFAVYGDTRTNAGTHQRVIDQIAKLNPELVIHSGDMWDEYTQDEFRTILMKNSGLGRLLERGDFVVSRGNHESLEDYLGFVPSVSRGARTERFSFAAGNSFFVVMGMDPEDGVAFLEQELKSAASRNATWRFVVSHYPIYSGGEHGATGIAAIERLCDTHHVAVYWNGHDHIYERSQQIFGQKTVDTGNALTADVGTVYVVAGGGGAPLYNSTKIASTHTNFSVNNYVEVSASATTLTVTARNLTGAVIDAFTISR
jgi:predicted phosphodiesterase